MDSINGKKPRDSGLWAKKKNILCMRKKGRGIVNSQLHELNPIPNSCDFRIAENFQGATKECTRHFREGEAQEA